MKLKDLPKWKELSKREQNRLLKIAKNREESGYNVEGELSISKKELKKGEKNV